MHYTRNKMFSVKNDRVWNEWIIYKQGNPKKNKQGDFKMNKNHINWPHLTFHGSEKGLQFPQTGPHPTSKLY